MATTIVEWFKKPGNIQTMTVRELIPILKSEYESDQRNEDKSGDSCDAAYYQGRKDAIGDILIMFGWRVKK